MTPGLLWSLTPIELQNMIDGNRKNEMARERRTAALAINIMNACGRLNSPISISDLFREE